MSRRPAGKLIPAGIAAAAVVIGLSQVDWSFQGSETVTDATTLAFLAAAIQRDGYYCARPSARRLAADKPGRLYLVDCGTGHFRVASGADGALSVTMQR